MRTRIEVPEGMSRDFLRPAAVREAMASSREVSTALSKLQIFAIHFLFTSLKFRLASQSGVFSSLSWLISVYSFMGCVPPLRGCINDEKQSAYPFSVPMKIKYEQVQSGRMVPGGREVRMML